MRWQLRPDGTGELRAIRPDGSDQTPDKLWKELSLKINQRALKGNHSPLEIFLYLCDGLHNSIYDEGTLEKIVASARDHAWGGRLYVVWDTFAETVGKDSNQVLLAKCFCTFLHGGVTDVIQIPRNEKPPMEMTPDEENRALRGLATSSEKRTQTLKAVVGEEGWGYILRDEAWSPESLLGELARAGCLPTSNANHVVIFDATPEYGPKQLLDKFKRINSAKKGIVAATPQSYTRDLKYQCETETPPLEIVAFNGILEVIYALLQLNKARGFKTSGHSFGEDIEVEIEPVTLVERPIFRSHAGFDSQRLLITAAFHPKEERAQSIAAAREVGAILRELPFNIDIEVHPSITCESLPDLLESRHFAAWIHLSHGEEQSGLYEANLGQYASPERWLLCFASYRKSLKLALFSSCESAPVAKLFAEAGTSVAVGFRHSVLVEATRILAKIIVRVAVQSQSDQDAILDAFRDACASLAARTTPDEESYIAARPIAFRSTGN